MPRDHRVRQFVTGLDCDEIARLRNQSSRPEVEAFFAWAEVEQDAVRDQRGWFRTAFGHAFRQKEALVRFLDDGRLNIDNTASERELRQIAVTWTKSAARPPERRHGSANMGDLCRYGALFGYATHSTTDIMGPSVNARGEENMVSYRSVGGWSRRSVVALVVGTAFSFGCSPGNGGDDPGTTENQGALSGIHGGRQSRRDPADRHSPDHPGDHTSHGERGKHDRSVGSEGPNCAKDGGGADVLSTGTGGQSGGAGGIGGGAALPDGGVADGGPVTEGGGGLCLPSDPFGSWTTEPAGRDLLGLVVLAADDIWTFDYGHVNHWDGQNWKVSLESTPPENVLFLQLWASSSHDVWVGGNTLRHWDGDRWEDAGLPPVLSIEQIWGSGPNDVWVIAEAQEYLEPRLIYHWNGTQWQETGAHLADLLPPPRFDTYPPPALQVNAIAGWAPDAVWAFGSAVSDFQQHAVILRWDGSAWQITGSPSDPELENTQFLAAVGGVNRVWVTAYSATPGLLTFDGSTLVRKATVEWPWAMGTPWVSCGEEVWIPLRSNSFTVVGAFLFHYAADISSIVKLAGDACTGVSGTSSGDVWCSLSIPVGGGLAHNHPRGSHEGPTCGNAVVEVGETCDPPDQVICGGTCHLLPACGDGTVDPGEQCDPPDGVACNRLCQFPRCGNSILEAGEQCDPPQQNESGVPWCDAQCQVPRCGNHVIDPGEECEPPHHAPPVEDRSALYCGMECKIISSCEQCRVRCAGASCDTLPDPTKADCHTLEGCAYDCLEPAASGYINAMACYCGLADAAACANGGAIGLCKAEYEKAMATTDPTRIIAGINDPSSVVSVAVKLAACGAGVNCGPAARCPVPNTRNQCGNGSVGFFEVCDPPDGATCSDDCRTLLVNGLPVGGSAGDGGTADGGMSDGGEGTGVCANPSPGFVWTPQPFADYVVSLWSAGPSDTWLATSSLVRHWNGSTWEAVPTPRQEESFLGLWGAGLDDVWLGSSRRLRRWNQTGWKDMLGFPVSSLWIAGTNDVWAVRALGNNALFHWNGVQWSEVPGPPAAEGIYPFVITALTGGSSTDIWAFGYLGGNPPSPAGALAHWDGTAWTASTELTDPRLKNRYCDQMWGTGTQLWAVVRSADGTDSTEIWHHDGTSWTIAHTIAGYAREASRIAGTSANDVWVSTGIGGISGVLVVHFDGTTWSSQEMGAASVSTLSAESPDIVWAGGTLVSHQGPSGPLLFQRHHGCADDPGNTGGDPTVIDGFRWSVEAAPAGQTGLWALGPNEVWRSSYESVEKWDGHSWGVVLQWDPLDPLANGFFGKIWGSSSTDVWVAGATLRHWDGSVWEDRTPDPDPSGFNGIDTIWGSAPDDVWVIKGSNGAPTHWDGTSWTAHPVVLPAEVPFVQFSALWGSAPNDVWAFGSKSTDGNYAGEAFIHWNGTTWTVVPDAADPAIQARWFVAGWGAAANDIWALAGSDAVPGSELWHYDGTAWVVARQLPGQNVGSVIWGSASDDVWASAPDGLLTRWDGHAFSNIDLNVFSLTAGASVGRDEVWVAGTYWDLGDVMFHGVRP